MHSILILLIALFCLSLGVFVWSSSITRRVNWKCLTSHTSIWCNHLKFLIESIAISMQWTHESCSGQWAAGQKYQFNQFNLFNYIELGFESEYASKYPPDTNISNNSLSYHFLFLCANALDSHRNKEFLITFCNILRLDPLFNWIKSPHQNAEYCCRCLLFAVYLKINEKKNTHCE